jgi:hypothetical protein
MLGKSEDKKEEPKPPVAEEPKPEDLVPEPVKEMVEEVEDHIA